MDGWNVKKSNSKLKLKLKSSANKILNQLCVTFGIGFVSRARIQFRKLDVREREKERKGEREKERKREREKERKREF